jgi:beta-phosphoglucomutase-like phosphatase (HAD superfamily)
MIPIRNISATLFDMDGTLVDSETLTEPAIVALCCELGVDDVGLDCSLFFGVAWREIERALLDKHPQMAGKAADQDVEGICHRSKPANAHGNRFIERPRIN